MINILTLIIYKSLMILRDHIKNDILISDGRIQFRPVYHMELEDLFVIG